MVNLWKHSRLRFYLKNTLWNYKFWLHAKPVYKDHVYPVEEGLNLENAMAQEVVQAKMKITKKRQKRFVGFLYKGVIYQDNPGIQGVDKQTWESWIQKKLIQL